MLEELKKVATKRQKDIVAYLTKNQKRWVTAGELAKFCGCTTRTIRNQVAKLNEEEQQILSSTQGYRIDENKKSLLKPDLDDTKEDRKAQLFLLLLKSTAAGIDLYDLAEKLYISESTLKNDIQALRQEMQTKNLKVTISDNRIYLAGSERDKRRYMISLLYDEGDYQEKLKYHIQDMIGEISLADLERRIRDVLALHQIKINQYSMNNIVLHFAISIERIRQGNNLKIIKDYPLNIHSTEYQISKEITDILSHFYQIDFSDSEIQQLALLFVGLQNEYLTTHKESKLSEFVELRFIKVLQEVLSDVKETYLIDLQDEAFFNKLAIHLQSLYDRSQYERFTRNSSLLDIKTAYPLTYDIAVYISMLLQEKLAIWFNDDEISFIALHIGAYLESKKDSGPKLRVLVDVNDYHDFETTNIKNLRNALEKDITIVDVKNQLNDIQNCDVYLTSDREKAVEVNGAVYVHPILTRKDLEKVQKRVTAKKKSCWRQKMFSYIDRFMVEELYIGQFDPSDSTPESIRQKMFQKMFVSGFVDSEFSKTMEKREAMSPTSFPSGIAVPHSIEQNAQKSAISVMTLQENIRWCNYSVEMVALVAIAQAESKEFNEFFEMFIEIVSEPVNVKQLAATDDFTEFILKLKVLVDADE